MAAHKLYGLQAMLELAKSEPGMSVLDRGLDADPYLIGVQNGVVDLRTGRLMENKPEMFVTRYCNADYFESAQCPTWLQFLDEVFQGERGVIHTVQQLLGYTLTGLSTEEILVICYGFGSNGKSVFSNVIHSILGGYGLMAPPSLLTARSAGDSSVRNDLAALAGARYVGINELQAGDRLDEQIVKMLAGREPITARFLHQEFFTFQPTFTPWLRTNHKPIITGTDDGIWRRLVMVPFKRKFTDQEKDPHLEARLMAERDGILMWMLEGARLYFKSGLQICPIIKAENAHYRSESDTLAEFLGDLTIANVAGKVEQSSLFKSWGIWCEDNKLPPGSKKSFTRRLSERGFGEARSNGRRFYTGLEFAPVTL
jgi:putative DNA primase/helicase